MLGKFNILDDVLIPSFATSNSASILLLYLWLLGGLLGVWSRTGAAQAFANYTAVNFVRGPRSAKFVAWLLGLVFFQGGTISTVLTGKTSPIWYRFYLTEFLVQLPCPAYRTGCSTRYFFGAVRNKQHSLPGHRTRTAVVECLFLRRRVAGTVNWWSRSHVCR